MIDIGLVLLVQIQHSPDTGLESVLFYAASDSFIWTV